MLNHGRDRVRDDRAGDGVDRHGSGDAARRIGDVAKTAQRPATYEDLMKVPDHLIAEIIEGELFTSPRPAGPHERALGAIHARIRSLFDDGDGPGGWWISVEPELHPDSDVLV